MRLRRRLLALGLVLAGAPLAGRAGADSFTPVRLTITTAPVARLHAPLAVAVRVSADPGALDDRSGTLRVRVKLAGECGGTYRYTAGVVLIDQALSPQPSTGRAYSALARGAARPNAFGVQVVCVWLDDSQGRTWASDQSTQVNVSVACTRRAARYDAARRRPRRRNPAAARRQRRIVAADRRAAVKACGPGVPL